MPFGNRLTTPQTDWGQTSGSEDFIREAQVRQMQKFEREAMAQGLEKDPTASAYSEAFHNAREYGFDPPPDVPEYSGNPGGFIKPLGPGFGPFPPIQPGPIGLVPGGGAFRQIPNNPGMPVPPPLNLEGMPGFDPLERPGGPFFPTHQWKMENWNRHMEDQLKRGLYTVPPSPGDPPGWGGALEQLPATKVYSAPLPSFGTPPQPPG